MGFRMAGNIRKRMPPSTTLHVFDIVHAACERFVTAFGSFGPIEIARTSREVAEKSQTVISMVPTGENAKEVYLHPQSGIVSAQKIANRLMLECSTIEVKTTMDIGQAIMDTGAGFYIDAPVSGGTAGAEAANLSFMVGYDPTLRSDPWGQRIQEVLNQMGAPDRVTFCGGLGTGLVCKTVNNCIGLSNIVTVAEGMAIDAFIEGHLVNTIIHAKGSSGDL